jgi:hypothetical protein
VALALPAPAQQPLALITGMTQPTTPFHAHLEAWQAMTHLRGKYLYQAVVSIMEFAKAVPCCLETLDSSTVQGWIDNQLRPTDSNKPALPTTVRRKLTAIRSYWSWMQDNGKVDQERHRSQPSVRDHHRSRTLEAQPKAFDVIDMPRLWQQAEADRDLYA